VTKVCGFDVRNFLIILDRLDLSVILVRAKIAFFRVKEVFVKGMPLNFNRKDSTDDVPVDELGAWGLRTCSLVNPSFFVIYLVQDVTDFKLRSYLVLGVFKFKLSKEILQGLVLDLIDFIEFLHTEKDDSGCMLDVRFFIYFFSIVEHLHFNIVVMTVNSVL